MLYRHRQGGFVKAVIIIVIALIVLGYFGYNVADIVKRPVVQNNLEYAWGLVQTTWDKFVETPTLFVWNQVAGVMGWTMLQNDPTEATSTSPVI